MRRELCGWRELMGSLVALMILTTQQTASGAVPAKPRPGPGIWFVAPNGNDAWSGRLPAPNRSKRDGPFATMARARDAVRQMHATERKRRPATVFLRRGTYFLSEPIVFTPDDSGTKEAPVAYRAYGDGAVVISGGRRITGWERVEVGGRRLWKAFLPPQPHLESKEAPFFSASPNEGATALSSPPTTAAEREAGERRWFFRQLWVNGQRRPRARHPNQGYLRVAEVPDATPQTPWHEGQTRFGFHPGDLPAWETTAEAQVVVMNRWTESHLPVTLVDETEQIVTLARRSVFRLEPGDLYYLEHALEALDTPGEWYLDREAGALYYLPLPNETPRRATVVAPVLSQLLRFEGRPEENRFVEHLLFRDLTFSHTEWWFPNDFRSAWPKPDVGGFPQAAVGVPGAIYAEGARNLRFDGCTIAHVGGYAVELARGCEGNRITGSTLFDLGAGGVKIGETLLREAEAERARGNVVADCHIYDGGRIFHSAVGIWIGQSPENQIARNHIHDFYYTGLSVGWTWGYGASLARGNRIEGNRVHHIGVRSDGDGPILSDMGGIYTLGIQPGTVIRGNQFHDIAGYRYGGWGIYLDEGSSQILVENNLVYRTTHGGFHQHYGRENVVRNNVFALGRDAQIQRTRAEPHESFRFERNLVYWQEGELLAGNWSDFRFAFDRNLYWRVGGESPRFGSLSWEEWRAKGMDLNSRVADPLFVAPERGDFSLRPGSPALELGFEPIDPSRAPGP